MAHHKECATCPSQGERSCPWCDVYLKAEEKARRRGRRQGRARKQQALPIWLPDAIGTPSLFGGEGAA